MIRQSLDQGQCTANLRSPYVTHAALLQDSSFAKIRGKMTTLTSDMAQLKSSAGNYSVTLLSQVACSGMVWQSMAGGNYEQCHATL